MDDRIAQTKSEKKGDGHKNRDPVSGSESLNVSLQ